MKRLQCTNCRQIFWAGLEIDETQVGRGEWVQNPCPRCGAMWATVEPPTGRVARRGRKGRPGPKRRARAGVSPVAEEKATGFSPSAIRGLRKRLKVSQKELASLIGVSAGAIISWEAGRFRPRPDKVAQLSNLAKPERENVKKLLGEKSKGVEKKPPLETPPPGKAEAPKRQGKGKRGKERKKGQGERKKK